MKAGLEMRKSCLNRDLAVGSDGWIHLVPKGEFPGRLSGVAGSDSAIIQVCDDEALNRIMAAFAEQAAKSGFTGLLLDKEHFSHDLNQSSEACAWIMKLDNRADGIWGFPEWTDMGKPMIDGKRYKRLSPSFVLDRIADRRYRPVVLTDAALTNAAKLPLIPIQNRDGGANEEETGMNQLAEMLRARLGLDAAADEAAIMAAIGSALDKAKTQGEELTKANDAAMNREADAWCEKHKGLLTDVVKAKALFVLNRQAAEDMIALVKPAATPRTLNRQDGQPPAKGPTDTENPDKRATALNRAARDYRSAHPRATFEEAWEAAKEAVEQG